MIINVSYAPLDGQLATYVKNDQVWACPSDDNKMYSDGNASTYHSYIWDGKYDFTGGKAMRRSYGYILTINDAHRCTTEYGGAATGYPQWKGHNGMENYVMADGHAKTMAWGTVRKNDFYMFKRRKPTTTYGNAAANRMG